jgi:hypothetical protein
VVGESRAISITPDAFELPFVSAIALVDTVALEPSTNLYLADSTPILVAFKLKFCAFQALAIEIAY